MSAATLVRPVKQMPTGQTAPSDRTKIATSEQIRIAQLISDKNEDSEALKSNIHTVMELTGRPESVVIVALHDCDNDVQQTINQLLEGSAEQQGEWQQAGKKPKRQQHNHQTAAENHHDDHNHHQTDEFYDESGEGHQDLSLTRNSRTRGGFNGNSDQPPRFRGRGGGGRGGFANGEYKGRGKENEPLGGSDQLGHSDGFDRGRGRGRGGGMSRPPRDASDRGRGRGRGGGVGVPRRGRGDGDRGVRSGGSESERAGFGRIDTWTNSNVVETNVWDNSMAKFVAKPAASESNTWDNSMADSVLKKDSRADTSADDWTGEDTDWSSSETRVFINQAAQKQQQLPVTVQPQSQSGAQQPSQTAPGSLTFGRSQQGSMELNNFSHAGSQQHFHGGHGEAIDVNLLFNKSNTPAESATFNAQPPTSGPAWNRQATDTLKNELGIGKISLSTPGVDQTRQNSQQPPSHTQSFRSESLMHKTKTPVEMPDNLVGKVDVEFGNFGTLDSHHLSSDLSFSNSSNLTSNSDRLGGQQQQRIINSTTSVTYQRTPTKDQQLNGPSDYHPGSASKDLGTVKSDGIAGGYANAAQVFGKTDQSQQHYINSSVKSSVTPQKAQSSVLSSIGDRGSAVSYAPSNTGDSIQTMKYTPSKLHQNLEPSYDSTGQQNLNSSAGSQAGLHSKATVINNSNLQKQSAGSLQQLQQGQQQQQQPQGQQQQQNVNQLAAAAVASGFPYNQQFAAQMNAAPYLASLYPMFRPEDYGLLQQQMMPNVFDMSSLGGQPPIIPSMSGGRDSNAYSTGDMKISRSDGSTQAQSATNSLAGAPPGAAPPGLTPTVSNAQTAAMLSQLTGFPYNVNPYYYPVAPPLMMQQQVAANPAASNLLSGYQQKPTGYPQGYNNTGYEESLSQDFSKAPTYGGMNQGQKAGQNNTGGTTGVNYSSGDLKSGYNAGMNKPLQPGFDTKSFAQPQQHSTVGTPPPFNNAQFQGAFPFQNTPGQAQAQFLTNPYFPMMHSPLPAQMQTHQTISGDNMSGTGGVQRAGSMQGGQQQQQQQGKSVNSGGANVGGSNKPQNSGAAGFPPGFPTWST